MAALAPIFLLGGCDMFRGLSGRPSPVEVSLQEEIETGAQMVDSLKTAKEEMDEELGLANAIRVVNADVAFIDDNAGDLYAGIVRGNYYVVVGSFAVESNFERMVRTVLDAGYLPTGFTLKNGMHCVALCPVDKSREAEYAFIGVLKESFCPDDAFIMYVK
ncbi:MAG: hypothetical protein LUD72_08125 [Bacteroidales bacterium]|nr:hypothetical protein [Bacteroidales bacterium]